MVLVSRQRVTAHRTFCTLTSTNNHSFVSFSHLSHQTGEEGKQKRKGRKRKMMKREREREREKSVMRGWSLAIWSHLGHVCLPFRRAKGISLIAQARPKQTRSKQTTRHTQTIELYNTRVHREGEREKEREMHTCTLSPLTHLKSSDL